MDAGDILVLLLLLLLLNKIKRQEKKGDSYQSQWEVKSEKILNICFYYMHRLLYKDASC